MTRLDEVRQFWFGDTCVSPASLPDHQARWFMPDATIDSAVRNRFGTLPDQAMSGTLPHGPDDPADLLALVLILDQFPRQLYRNTVRAFDLQGARLFVATEAAKQQENSAGGNGDDDGGALPSELLRHGQADAAASAGDPHHLICKASAHH